MNKNRSFWGWGVSEYQLDKTLVDRFKGMLQVSLGIEEFEEKGTPQIENIYIRDSRFKIPENISEFCTNEKWDRLAHHYGKSFRDIWRGLNGQFLNPPDYVAYPKTESDIASIFEFAGNEGVAVVPFGGGSSVSGGVEPVADDRYVGVITVDMKHFNQVLEIDHLSRAARIQAGMFGPDIEKALKPHGLTLRHYPQSFEFSTLGGWIVTRSGGHFATLYTHIDEFVQSVKMLTPNGIMQTRRLPGSGAGPSEERLVSGSEGIFGIVTEAWMRLQTIPKFKAAQTVSFAKWEDAVDACRSISQSGLHPSNARLVSPLEALSNGLGTGEHSVLILGFESHNHEVDHWMTEALQISEKHSGVWTEKADSQRRDESADNWKNSFLAAPYLRDQIVKLGCIAETFETAVTWDQFDAFHKGVMDAGQQAIQDICGAGTMTCRFTHIYPDGPAPYYTIIARGKPGREMEQWDQIKKIVSDTLIELGGTITHHHAVGKDHQAHYANQMSAKFHGVLSSIKSELDPNWILNPDVLLKRN